MRDAAIMAAVMPGFGNPLALPIDDFLQLMEHVKVARAIGSGRPLSITDIVELER